MQKEGEIRVKKLPHGYYNYNENYVYKLARINKPQNIS